MKTVELIGQETIESISSVKLTVLPTSKLQIKQQRYNIRLEYVYHVEGQEICNFIEFIFASKRFFNDKECIIITRSSEHIDIYIALNLANRLAYEGDIFEAVSDRYNKERITRLNSFVTDNPEYVHLIQIDCLT